MKVKRKEKMVTLIIGNKAWKSTRKMADATIELGKKKYKEENVNAIVAVEKDNMISLLKDVFDTTESLVEEITKWQRGGYKCYYTMKKQEEK